MEQLVRDTFLEMTDASQDVSFADEQTLDIRQAEIPCPDTSRFFYTTVGAEWGWYNRLDWDREHWLAHASRPDLTTWIAFLKGSPAGYLELISYPNNEIEIRSFGLLPTFIGRGLGKEFLSATINLVWQRKPSRLWLSTCSLDHPRALPNYQAAGFKIFKTTEAIAKLPDHPPTAWPAKQPEQSANQPSKPTAP